jgi:hypothetical protein
VLVPSPAAMLLPLLLVVPPPPPVLLVPLMPLPSRPLLVVVLVCAGLWYLTTSTCKTRIVSHSYSITYFKSCNERDEALPLAFGAAEGMVAVVGARG